MQQFLQPRQEFLLFAELLQDLGQQFVRAVGFQIPVKLEGLIQPVQGFLRLARTGGNPGQVVLQQAGVGGLGIALLERGRRFRQPVGQEEAFADHVVGGRRFAQERLLGLSEVESLGVLQGRQDMGEVVGRLLVLLEYVVETAQFHPHQNDAGVFLRSTLGDDRPFQQRRGRDDVFLLRNLLVQQVHAQPVQQRRVVVGRIAHLEIADGHVILLLMIGQPNHRLRDGVHPGIVPQRPLVHPQGLAIFLTLLVGPAGRKQPRRLQPVALGLRLLTLGRQRPGHAFQHSVWKGGGDGRRRRRRGFHGRRTDGPAAAQEHGDNHDRGRPFGASESSALLLHRSGTLSRFAFREPRRGGFFLACFRRGGPFLRR